MNVPLSWLNDYIDLPESVEELRDLLTFSGLEVEAVHIHGSDLAGIVTAEITGIRPHPDADKLTLCTLDTGSDEQPEVVCGAPNVRQGLKTVFAPVGTTLPNGMKLKKAKIRGVVSLGMLCAEDELGLSGDHSGIVELPEDTRPGTAASTVLGGPEVVFELEVTPNRPDCLSIIGVARELAALTSRDLKIPECNLPDPSGSETVEVEIRNSEACPRYTARCLTGCTVGPSPDWMQQRLRLAGLRPINNLVDITNYVMLETGQPLHAFDRTLLNGDVIRIRNASDGEIMHTLDGEERKLTPADLVIADQDTPVALAGVMGGANSEIRDTTSDVLVESAAFAGPGIRATARRLDAHTDSSYRFARGCDVTRVEWAGRRAAALMVECAGGTVTGPVVDAYPGEQDSVTLTCEWERITSLIGVEIPVDTMKGYFERLELKVIESSETGCTVQIPGHRLDLTRPVDLTEEIARLNGLDDIPVHAPKANIVPDAEDHPVRVSIGVWKYLSSRGFLESMNYSLTSPDLLKDLDPDSSSDRVVLPNPISQDQSILRTSLLPHMVQTLAFNASRQTDELALFESGKIYRKVDKGVEEALHVCLGAMGPWKRPELDKQRSVDAAEAFADLKGEVENLLASLNAHAEVHMLAEDHAPFAKGQSASLMKGSDCVGRIGLLDAPSLRRFKLSGPVALAEVDLSSLIPDPEFMPAMTPVPEFPSVTRDEALILDRNRTHAEVLEIVNAQRPKDLEDIRIFDIFEGNKLGENKKSMAYRFTYRSRKKTLTEDGVEKMHRRIVQRLVEGLKAEIVGR